MRAVVPIVIKFVTIENCLFATFQEPLAITHRLLFNRSEIKTYSNIKPRTGMQNIKIFLYMAVIGK